MHSLISLHSTPHFFWCSYGFAISLYVGWLPSFTGENHIFHVSTHQAKPFFWREELFEIITGGWFFFMSPGGSWSGGDKIIAVWDRQSKDNQMEQWMISLLSSQNLHTHTHTNGQPKALVLEQVKNFLSAISEVHVTIQLNLDGTVGGWFSKIWTLTVLLLLIEISLKETKKSFSKFFLEYQKTPELITSATWFLLFYLCPPVKTLQLLPLKSCLPLD